MSLINFVFSVICKELNVYKSGAILHLNALCQR